MRILIKVDSLDTGMYYHRLFTPFNAIFRDKLAEGHATPCQQMDNGKWGSVIIESLTKEEISQFDAVVFSRMVYKPTIDFLKEHGVKVVLDIDDYWHLDKSHALYEVTKNSLAKDTEYAISNSDLVMTPTKYLTDECRKLNKNSHTVKTAIDKTHEQWSTPTISSPLTRFGWIGGIHHRQDVSMLANMFIQAHSTLKNYQFCLGGFSTQKYEYKELVKGKVIKKTNLSNGYYYELEKYFTNNYKSVDEDYRKWLHEFSQTLPDHISYFKNYRRLWTRPIDQYGKLYDEIDISLIPLSGLGVFNQFKSELKLIEAGTKGKMAIVSKVKPYTLIPDDCVHFINNSSEWYEAVKYCLENREYVKDKAAKLKEYIDANYALENENKLRLELIESVCKK